MFKALTKFLTYVMESKVVTKINEKEARNGPFIKFLYWMSHTWETLKTFQAKNWLMHSCQANATYYHCIYHSRSKKRLATWTSVTADTSASSTATWPPPSPSRTAPNSSTSVTRESTS